MEAFTFTYPTKVYFGHGVAAQALWQELAKVGRTVMLAYGGGSVKRSGVYDELKGLLLEAGKEDAWSAFGYQAALVEKKRRGL